jgi:DNA-binding NarL/FixJ family response regulator
METLTERELEVVKQVVIGLPNKTIAKNLFISIKTMEKHRQSVYNKLHIHDVVKLTHWALHKGIVQNMFSSHP